jgi:predicted metalloprotease with PDZ domain
MHLLDMNSKIVQYNTNRSIDDVVLSFYHRHENGSTPTLLNWLALMEKDFGPIATKYYERMAAGDLIVPAKDSLGPEFEVIQENREQFHLGFAEESLSTRIISELEEGSRAALAGLKNGDFLIRSSPTFQSFDDFRRNMTLLVNRGGEEVEVSFWPRSFTKVECYQWRGCRVVMFLHQNTARVVGGTRLEFS